MPNPVGRRRGEAWDRCAVCDFEYPVSQLSLQKGMKKCRKCFDDLECERRESYISKLLTSPEGEVTRDALFMLGEEEVEP